MRIGEVEDGGDDDSDRGLKEDFGGDGVIGKYVFDEGDSGASSKLGADFDALAFADDAMASKALILDCTPTETSEDIV